MSRKTTYISIEPPPCGTSAIRINEQIRTRLINTFERLNGNEEPVMLDEEDMADFDLDDTCVWAKAGVDYYPTQQVVDKIPAGQYTIMQTQRGICFSKHEINLDDILVLPDSASEEVVREIELFWTKEDKFREFGFLWKRGVLMYGPPGSGKTSTVQIISKKVIDMGGITIYCTEPLVNAAGLALLRIVEPKRPIVVIIEDIDSVIERFGEAELLALLDGQLQVDNVVFLATTNYPENLDKRMTNRPSRFDLIKEVGFPSPDARKLFLEKKNPVLSAEDIDLWVDKTDGFTIAHLKEMIVYVECLGNTFEDALSKIRDMIDNKLSSEGKKHKLGIGD